MAGKTTREPQTWQKKRPEGLSTTEGDTSIERGERPAWVRVETLKAEIWERYERTGLIHEDRANRKRFLCIGCGRWHKQAKAIIEHSYDWKDIKENLQKDAKTLEERKKYSQADALFYKGANEEWKPTQYAYYAFYHDISNLTFMCQNSNVQGNGNNAKTYPQFLVHAPQNQEICEFLKQQICTESLQNCELPNPERGIEGWADWVFNRITNSLNFQVALSKMKGELDAKIATQSESSSVTNSTLVQAIRENKDAIAKNNFLALDQSRTTGTLNKKEQAVRNAEIRRGILGKRLFSSRDDSFMTSSFEEKLSNEREEREEEFEERQLLTFLQPLEKRQRRLMDDDDS